MIQIKAFVNQSGGFSGAPGQTQSTIALSGERAASPTDANPNADVFSGAQGNFNMTLNQPSDAVKAALVVGKRYTITIAEVLE